MIKNLMRLVALLLVAAVFAYGVLFYMQNENDVAVNLLLVQIPAINISFLLIGAMILGCLIGMAGSGLIVLKLKAQNRALTRKLDKA